MSLESESAGAKEKKHYHPTPVTCSSSSSLILYWYCKVLSCIVGNAGLRFWRGSAASTLTFQLPSCFWQCNNICRESVNTVYRVQIDKRQKSHIEIRTLVRSNRPDTHNRKGYHTARLTPLLRFLCLLLYLHLSMVFNNDTLQISFSSLKVKLCLWASVPWEHNRDVVSALFSNSCSRKLSVDPPVLVSGLVPCWATHKGAHNCKTRI